MPPEVPRPCAHPGCSEAGEFRAPAGPGATERWRYFCLEHVRAFNSDYDFFRGMSAEELAEAQSPLAGWKSEWLREPARRFAHSAFDDPHGLFGGRDGKRSAAAPRRWSEGERRSLAVLDLDEDATPEAIRRRYHELIRRYHPDANGGSRDHEARLQAVIAAYTQLKRGKAA